ncbi:MAG: HAMP domain-containing sensor histidine kinase [Chthoniobacterales bacterium]
MPESELSARFAIEALGYALFRQEENGSLRAVGEPPAWLRALWPILSADGAEFPTAEASPFFENFLIDATECWRAGGMERAHSGPWIEEQRPGERVELEATALTAGKQRLLLLKRLGAEFAAKKEVLQRARETVIAHQRLNSEVQKKEILLHCVADEMTATLANIVTSLRLIEGEDNPPRTKLLLGLATRGTEEQQLLINRVLDVFAEEITSIYGNREVQGKATEWNPSFQHALDAIAPAFAEKRVRLALPVASKNGAFEVGIDASHLERIITGLLENALERVSAGGVVEIAVAEESDAILCRVTDNAPRMSSGAYDALFSKFGLPAAGSQASALRLHFCRIAIESCGGEIGCEPGEHLGNVFWFRLPKHVAR